MKKNYDELLLKIVMLDGIKDIMFGSGNGDNYEFDDFIIG